MDRNDKRQLERHKEIFVEMMTEFMQKALPLVGNLAFRLMEVALDDPQRLASLCAQSGVKMREQPGRVEYFVDLPSIKFLIVDEEPTEAQADAKERGRRRTSPSRRAWFELATRD